MSWDSNLVFLIGRLTRDPVISFTHTGKQVAKFTIAVGHGKDSASFIDIVAWENTADVIGRYVHKGDQIGIDGSLKQNRYTGSDGQNYSKLEVQADKVQFLSKKGSGQSGHAGYASESDSAGSGRSPSLDTNTRARESGPPGLSIELLDDEEVPF